MAEPNTLNPKVLRPMYLSEPTRTAATTYHQHHFRCPVCIAAGKGNGDCCAIGAPIHQAYLDAFAVDRRRA